MEVATTVLTNYTAPGSGKPGELKVWPSMGTESERLRLPGTHAAKIDKIRPPLHVSLKIF